MMKQKHIAEILRVSQPTINLVLTGKRKVSWPLAQKLSNLFPGKTIAQWKNASPEELRIAFSQLETLDAQVEMEVV